MTKITIQNDVVIIEIKKEGSTEVNPSCNNPYVSKGCNNPYLGK